MKVYGSKCLAQMFMAQVAISELCQFYPFSLHLFDPLSQLILCLEKILSEFCGVFEFLVTTFCQLASWNYLQVFDGNCWGSDILKGVNV